MRSALQRLGAAAAGGALPAPALAAGWGAALAARQLRAAAPAAAHAGDALSSGKAPTDAPPDAPTYREGPGGASFDKLADLYLGGIWEKMESGLRGTDQQGGRLDLQLGHEGLTLGLPDGGRIEVAKDPEREALVVRSTLHDTFGSDGALNEVPFKLQADRRWETDGEELHQFLEDNLAKHLKVQVDLEPEAQTMYGPDPT